VTDTGQMRRDKNLFTANKSDDANDDLNDEYDDHDAKELTNTHMTRGAKSAKFSNCPNRFAVVYYYYSNPRWRCQQKCKFNVFCVTFGSVFQCLLRGMLVTDSYDNYIICCIYDFHI